MKGAESAKKTDHLKKKKAKSGDRPSIAGDSTVTVETEEVGQSCIRGSEQDFWRSIFVSCLVPTFLRPIQTILVSMSAAITNHTLPLFSSMT